MKKRSVNTLSGGGGPAEPVPYTSSELADDVKTRGELAARALAFRAKGGEVAESHLYLNPCECTPNMTKALAGCRTTLIEKKGNKRASARIKVLLPHSAFTMAEILLSLTIIGVVAAITLPALTGNINERTWNTQRKALYARFSQAIALMPALNGYGNLAEGLDGEGNKVVTVDTAAETFVTEGLSKVLKINNICDSEHLQDCGIAAKINPMGNGSPIELESISTLVGLNSMFNGSYDGQSYSQIDTKAAAFETANGESILAYYNPSCQHAMLNFDDENLGRNMSQAKMCANFIYDLNGNKGPNTVGKDIGIISVIYPTDPVVVAPMPLPRDSATADEYQDAVRTCRGMDSESRLPNIEELSSIFYNKRLFGMGDGSAYAAYWSSSLYQEDKDRAWGQNFDIGHRVLYAKNADLSIRCIKR